MECVQVLFIYAGSNASNRAILGRGFHWDGFMKVDLTRRTFPNRNVYCVIFLLRIFGLVIASPLESSSRLFEWWNMMFIRWKPSGKQDGSIRGLISLLPNSFASQRNDSFSPGIRSWNAQTRATNASSYLPVNALGRVEQLLNIGL